MDEILIRETVYCDPLRLLGLVRDLPFPLLLDSATAGPGRDPRQHGRWTFVAAEPFETLVATGARIEVSGGVEHGDPFTALAARLRTWRLAARHDRDDAPPFVGGAAGYLGYELAGHLERLPQKRPDGPVPDLAVGFYDSLVAFDQVNRRAYAVSTGFPASGQEQARRARERADAWLGRLARASCADDLSAVPPRSFQIASTFTRDAYERAVARVIEYVLAGDVFEVNLSHRLTAECGDPIDPVALYLRLRAASPAPFAGFFDCGTAALLSSSPERFLHLRGGRVETRPIKGTRPRGDTPEQDRALAAELLASEKDRAENVMIVDLLRNDLSRVSLDGSVRVEALCELERYATVHHLVSTVSATLRSGCGPVDLLRATFPGGSVTGAPKIRAMEIIAELEPVARGAYCGAMGYIGFDGVMDTNILIRTMTVAGSRVQFGVGGAVVAQSDPGDEYAETITKARGMLAALGADPAAADLP